MTEANGLSGSQKAIRLLLIEDSADDAELVVRDLERGGYAVSHQRVQTVGALRAAFAVSHWDVVLSDYAMPEFSGVDALSVVKELGLDVPFIIVSGVIGEAAAVRAMQSGAHDYVLKDSLARLCPAVDRELREAALRAEQRKLREQLLISDRMASVGTLAAGMAHEINNPLAAIVTNLELMSRDLKLVAERFPVGEALREVVSELQDARESADRLRDIVQDLKIFSRCPDDEHREAVDVQHVIESSLRMAHNEIRHRARLVRDYAVVPLVDGNESRLGQVFLNLIVNAAQSMPEGDVVHNEIRVTTRVNAMGGVVIEVRDTGSGISPEHLPRIFDAFFTTKPVGIGTGLGLSICHRIVCGLGGQLEVESKLGEGSVFRLTLHPAPITLQVVKLPAAPVLAATRRGRVLVIDDEPMIATAIGRTLAFDHDVAVASDAASALQRITGGERFDLILCDLMMPQMTGMELHAQLLRNAPEQAGQMVFLSGGAFTPGARAFLEAVPNQRLEKPFDSRQLLVLVNEHICGAH
jgi:signal transduction histidine kinase